MKTYSAPALCSFSCPQESLRKAEFPLSLGGRDTCYFCKKRVYLMERLSAEGHFFHRECFRCSVCAAILRVAAYAFDCDEGNPGGQESTGLWPWSQMWHCSGEWWVAALGHPALTNRNTLLRETGRCYHRELKPSAPTMHQTR